MKHKTEGKTYVAFVAVAVGAIGLVWAGTYTYGAFQSRRALHKAEAQIKKGFASLAVETLEPYRHKLISHAKGCPVMIAIYNQARRVDRLEWVSQACLDSGRDAPESYIGLASASELSGRDGDALNILAAGAGKFDKVPDLYYSIAQIFKRNKKDNEALVAYQKALERAPQNNQLALEIMEYLTGLNKWDTAKMIADKLKTVQTDNPEVKLFLARVFMKNGDKESQNALVTEAKALMAKNEQIKPALERAYSDVLGTGGPKGTERNLASEKPVAKK